MVVALLGTESCDPSQTRWLQTRLPRGMLGPKISKKCWKESRIAPDFGQAGVGAVVCPPLGRAHPRGAPSCARTCPGTAAGRKLQDERAASPRESFLPCSC